MATGVPSKRSGTNRGANGATSMQPEVRLEYPGKKSTSDILAIEPSVVERVWRGGERTSNRLYFGDNTGVLACLANDPAVSGRVRLVYIDPPFATQSAFHSRTLDHAYHDTLAGPEFLEFIRERLVLLHSLLADDGSLYLHLDERMVFQAKIILDEVFGPDGYRNCISRRKCNPKNYTRKKYGNVKDYILFYTKSKAYVWNKPVEDWTDARSKEYRYTDPETGRRFMKVPIHAPGVRRGETGRPWRGMLPPAGKHWQYTPRVLDEMDATGDMFWSANGNPRRKVYLDESAGVGVQDIWLDFPDAHNQNICITGYPTEKNPDLVKRIVEASSNPGDLVLDCFAGSGTTAVVATALGRSWIAVDNSPEAIRTTLRRFTLGTERMGDFVGKRVSNPSKPNDMFALLGLDEEASSPQVQPPVCDFEFLAEYSLVSQALPLVREWEGLTQVGRG